MEAADVCCTWSESNQRMFLLSRPIIEQVGVHGPRKVQRLTCDHTAGYLLSPKIIWGHQWVIFSSPTIDFLSKYRLNRCWLISFFSSLDTHRVPVAI